LLDALESRRRALGRIRRSGVENELLRFGAGRQHAAGSLFSGRIEVVMIKISVQPKASVKL
jgi:hypothetical protein